VALSNPDMDDLYKRVGVGTRVTIVGGDGRDGAFSDLLARVGSPPGTEGHDHRPEGPLPAGPPAAPTALAAAGRRLLGRARPLAARRSVQAAAAAGVLLLLTFAGTGWDFRRVPPRSRT